jgi:hypothetical protein
MPDYHSAFSAGEYVRIASVETLRQFQQSWKWHHPLQDVQLSYAGKDVRVANVSYYHGGTPLYELVAVPGTWHEPCLVDVTLGEQADSGMVAANHYSVTSEKRHGLACVVVRDPEKRELLIAFRLNADSVAEAMRAVAQLRSRRMFEHRYGFDGMYKEPPENAG